MEQGVASLAYLHRADVERFSAFALHFVVVQARAIADGNLRDRVRKILRAVERDEALDDVELRQWLGHD